MKIDIYKSAINGNKYLSVPEGTDVTKLKVPSNFDSDLTTLSPFKASLEIDPKKPNIAIESVDVIEQIERNGFAVHGAKLEIKITAPQPK